MGSESIQSFVMKLFGGLSLQASRALYFKYFHGFTSVQRSALTNSGIARGTTSSWSKFVIFLKSKVLPFYLS